MMPIPASREGAIAARAANLAVPREFLELLGKRSVAQLRPGEGAEKNMTVLFSDIRGFTALSESMTPREAFGLINGYLGRVEPELSRHHGFVDKYLGDGVMALFPQRADDAVDAAVALLARLSAPDPRHRAADRAPLSVGVGVNTGLVMVGTVGSGHRLAPTAIGDAVNLASRLESMTKLYGVPLLISEHTYYGLERRAGRDIRFIDRVSIRGKQEHQSVYEVFDADPPAVREAKRHTRASFEEAIALYHLRDVARAHRLLDRCVRECPQDMPARLYLDRCERFGKSGEFEGTGEIAGRIRWTRDFEIGEPVIDRQHRQLFACANRFTEAMRTSQDEAQADEVIAFLRDYVEEHFETEERCMRQRRYPLLELQRQQHQRFSADFAVLAREIRANLAKQRLLMQFKVQVTVVDWLVNHTLRLDRHFGRYLKRRQGARGKGAIR